MVTAVYKLKNISGANGTWAGQDIDDGDTYVVEESELDLFRLSLDVMQAVANGDLEVQNADIVFPDPVEGWNYFSGDNLPKSELDGTKLAVHSSPKPTVAGVRTYAVWTGCGDDIAGNDIGDGPHVEFNSEVDTAQKHVDVEFLANAGRVWIHEGYLRFEGGGVGDYMSADIRAKATPLQTSVDLDYELVDNGKGSNWVKLAAGGPGTGTHGFAGQPVLLPRSFSADGHWDYDGTNLTPNLAGTGGYHICDAEQVVHRYINRIPCQGSSYGYFTMSSNETTELPAGYYMRIIQHNVSNTVWNASVLMEIYRQRTHDP